MELREIVRWKYEHRNMESLYNIRLNESKDKISLEMTPDFSCPEGLRVNISIKDILRISEDWITCTFYTLDFCVDVWVNVSHMIVTQFN